MKNNPSVTGIEPGDSTIRSRILLSAAGVLSVFGLLGWRLIHLQVEKHDLYTAISERRYERVDQLEAHRGRIFDTRGKLLAGDEPVQKIVFDLGFLSQKEALATVISEAEKTKERDLLAILNHSQLRQRYLDHVVPILAKYTGREAGAIRVDIEARTAGGKLSGEEIIAREVSMHDGMQLREELENAVLGKYRPLSGRIGAIIFRDSFIRRYPEEVNLAHLSGMTGIMPGSKAGADPRGVSGLERFNEAKLKGVSGKRLIQVDGKGQELAAYRGEVIPPKHGANLRTTIDTGLMELVEREINSVPAGPGELSVAKMNPNRVIVALFEPKTMALRAVVTRDFTRQADAGPLMTNDLVEYVYEPGSTIKIATIAAALSAGKVGAATSIFLGNRGVYSDEEVKPIRDDHAFPSLSVEGIMVHSSNIGAFKLARQVGLSKFREYLELMGFTRPTEIHLPVEQKGWFPKKWNMQNLSRCAYGYTFSVTPAQMCSMLGCMLNEGMWSPLSTEEAWTDEQNRTIEDIVPPAPRRAITAKAAGQVLQMLIQVVEKGTAKLARSDLYEIGGKTGTSNKINSKTKTYDRDRQVVSFLGYIAASDGPRLAGLVIIDEPKLPDHMNYGGKLAAPLFRRIAEKAMNYYEVPAFFAVNEATGKAMKKPR